MKNYKYMDESGAYAPMVIVVDGRRIVNGSDEDYLRAGYKPYEAPETSAEERRAAEVEELKHQLQETDYIALKYIEGYDCDAEYPGWREQRMALRKRINVLEGTEQESEDGQV